MRELQEIAESLENKRLVALRLNLFGFAMGGLFRIIDTWFLSTSGNTTLLALQILGGVIWLVSLIQLLLIGGQIAKNESLKQLFNDELSARNRLETWKVGFVAVMVVQVVFLVLSLFKGYQAMMVNEISIYVAFCAVLGASIIQEELLSITLFQMEIDEKKYKIWNWRTFSFFHWIMNPGIAFNELLLGQRVPKVMLIDKESEKPLMERTYVPCPHCETIHESAVWSHKNKNVFKNWYGLYCPSCGGIIPCLLNVCSRVILAITYPLWFWRKEAARAKWIEKQKQKSVQLDTAVVEHKDVSWLKIGFMFGASMFVVMTIFFKVVQYTDDPQGDTVLEHVWDVPFLLTSLVLWTLGGLAFGYGMKYFMGRVNKRKASKSESEAI